MNKAHDTSVSHLLRALVVSLGIGVLMGLTQVSAATAAQGTFTADSYPATGHGEAIGGNTFTALGRSITCNGVNAAGELTAASSTLTLTGFFFAGCTEAEKPVTVTTNGCDVVLHAGEGEGHQWATSADLICPVGKAMETHTYTSESHGSVTCTSTVFAKSGLTGPTLTTETGTPDTIKAQGVVSGIAAQVHGGCTFGLTINTNAQLHIALTVTGANGNGIRID